MSQYAYGKLGVYELAGKQTEYPCGFDAEGKMTYDPNLFGDYEEVLKKTEARVAAVNAAHPSNLSRPVQWPGEGTAKRRAKSKERGVTANEKVWEEVCRLAAR